MRQVYVNPARRIPQPGGFGPGASRRWSVIRDMRILSEPDEVENWYRLQIDGDERVWLVWLWRFPGGEQAPVWFDTRKPWHLFADAGREQRMHSFATLTDVKRHVAALLREQRSRRR